MSLKVNRLYKIMDYGDSYDIARLVEKNNLNNLLYFEFIKSVGNIYEDESLWSYDFDEKTRKRIGEFDDEHFSESSGRLVLIND